MHASIWIKNIKFKNYNLELKNNSIVVFVGPNNTGKSKTLQELYSSPFHNGIQKTIIIDEVQLQLDGDESALLRQLEDRRIDNQYYYVNNSSQVQGINDEQLLKAHQNFYTTHSLNYRGSLIPFFFKQLTTPERLNLVNSPNNINFLTSAPFHPIHILKESGEKEAEFSRYFKLAFGQDVIVNHGAGNTIPLHIGERPIATVENDRVSKAYQVKLRALDQLASQGDGMKSFAGVFLGLFVQDHSVNIIDEPEAFLHPPQATLLGQMIANSLGDDKQIFIATHSEHILKGLLDYASDRLLVVRIERDGSINKINTLNNTEIKSIWSDPLLRHSNVLDGLFHKRAVLCESDSDCRFYSALTTAIVEKEGLVSPDILFIQSGGKHRFPVVVKALKKLAVPLTIIGDFDLYHQEAPLKTIYENLEGDWDEVKTDFKIVKQAIDQKRPELETNELKQSIEQIFTSVGGKVMPEDKIKLIQAELKKSSPWSQAKSSGKAYLPAGDAINAFNRVQSKLRGKGIIVLDIGEIEAFDKTVGGHGPKWINEVLEKDLLNDPELEVARNFVKEILLS